MKLFQLAILNRAAIPLAALLFFGLATADANPKPATAPPEGQTSKAPPAATMDAADSTLSPEDEALLTTSGEVIEIIDLAPPGSAHKIGEAELEQFESDDVHKILAAVPGVYIREEDGYGLRPNIGMRGTGSERSAKIALMEDGVLIAPAPYSAPAAYYFPQVTRMRQVEVLKGPAAIVHGPNTVGGALNLLTAAIPREREFTLDMAGGSDLYGKAHLKYGESTRHVGWLIEGVKLHTDGFKSLDGGGDTGFDKNDIMAKLRINSARSAAVYHELELKLGYADEISRETYTGLTDSDFDADPYRRYRGTQNDRMTWEHYQMQLSHRFELPGSFALVTTAYRNDFQRDWRKLNGFAGGNSLEEILANPSAGNNGVFYEVLTGSQDSLSAAETLLVGTNSRDFVSQGIQLSASAQRAMWGAKHELTLGTRLHFDEVERYHFEDGYNMFGGELESADMDRVINRDSTGSTTAWANHVQYRASVATVQLTAGLRTELISTKYRDVMTTDNDSDDDYFITIPGGGLVWQTLPSLGFLVGVHKGFVPVAPGQSPTASDSSSSSANPEESINYEAGFRWANRIASVEMIGFFSDYDNLLGTCSFSSGCASEVVGIDFNGGAVDAYGLESLAFAELRPIRNSSIRLPLRLTYTLQRARFQSSFSSNNPQWGDVSVDDELPYLPRHQLQAQMGVAGNAWDLNLSGRYVSAMLDRAGNGDLNDSERTESAIVLDVAASYELARWGKLYLTINNLLDEVHITARRPYGARPGVPRQIVVGYKGRL